MNTYKRLESMLYDYPQIKAQIKNIELEIEDLEDDYSTLSAVQYDKDSISKTNKFNSDVENKVINMHSTDKIKHLEMIKKKLQIRLNRIENALTTLTDRENLIIERRYFQRIKNIDIAAELDLTEEYVCFLKQGIINRLLNIILIKS